jgi:hypothetical protein
VAWLAFKVVTTQSQMPVGGVSTAWGPVAPGPLGPRPANPLPPIDPAGQITRN